VGWVVVGRRFSRRVADNVRHTMERFGCRQAEEGYIVDRMRMGTGNVLPHQLFTIARLKLRDSLPK